MKQYVLFVLIMILITACAPKVEVDIAKPVKTPAEQPRDIIESPKDTVTEKPITPQETNMVEIRQDAFYPEEKSIQENTEIKWIKKDTRTYKIVCYLDGARVVLSEDLKQGDTFTYKFEKEGKYTCITSPYGLRNVINVEPKEMLSPTGYVVAGNNPESPFGSSIALVAVLSVIALSFFIFGRKIIS